MPKKKSRRPSFLATFLRQQKAANVVAAIFCFAACPVAHAAGLENLAITKINYSSFNSKIGLGGVLLADGNSDRNGPSPSKNSAIDLAIQPDMFPELQPEFGRSKLLNISASLSF